MAIINESIVNDQIKIKEYIWRADIDLNADNTFKSIRLHARKSIEIDGQITESDMDSKIIEISDSEILTNLNALIESLWAE